MIGTRRPSADARSRGRFAGVSALTLTCLSLCLCVSAAGLSAQQLLDRVLARVNGEAITKTDVDAAIGLGIVTVNPGGDAEQTAVQQLIDRQLLLEEIARFPPPEPTQASVDREVQRLKQQATVPLAQLQRTTGVDDDRIRDMARDSLRIRSYLDERFGTSGQVTDDEVREYYQAHLQQFQRNGVTIPFDDAEPAARERAAADRRNTLIEQWMREVRSRADIVTPADEGGDVGRDAGQGAG
jgi:hypothetical protein